MPAAGVAIALWFTRFAKSKQADALIWAERIGFNAVYAVGGTLVRTA